MGAMSKQASSLEEAVVDAELVILASPPKATISLLSDLRTEALVTDVAGTVYLDYGVYGLPESFFLRPGLTVQEKCIGELTETELRSMLDALVEGSPGAR